MVAATVDMVADANGIRETDFFLIVNVPGKTASFSADRATDFTARLILL